MTRRSALRIGGLGFAALAMLAMGAGCGSEGESGTGTAVTSQQGAAQGDRASAFVIPGGDNSIPTFGEEASAGVRAEASGALTAYLRARERAEWQKVCADLVGKGRAELKILTRATKGGLRGCPAILEAFQHGVPASARRSTLNGEITALRVKGKEAFALFHGVDGSDYVMPMQLRGSDWKVTQIAPIQYPVTTGAPQQ